MQFKPEASSSTDYSRLLIEAVHLNDVDAVQVLVEKQRVDINGSRYVKLEGRRMYTCALGVAAMWGRRDMIEYLVSHGADTEQVNEFEETPLHVACNQGHLEVVKYLAEHSNNIETYNAFDCTPFLSACAEGRLEIAEYLLSVGADINKTTLGLGGNALHGAALVSGSVSVTQMLLEKGLKPQPNRYGSLPILDAASKGNEEVLMFWIDYYGHSTRHSRENVILMCNALNLAGTHFFLNNLDFLTTFRYFRKSTEMQVEQSLPDELFSPLSPIPVYGNCQELSTNEALEQLQTSHGPLPIIQHCLMVRERILSIYHASSARPFLRYHFILVRNGRAHEVMPMWIHRLERQMEIFVNDGVPTLIIALLITLSYSLSVINIDVDILPAFEKLVLVLQRLGENHKCKWGVSKLGLHLLSLTLKQFDEYRHGGSYSRVCHVVREFLAASKRGPNGETMLHCAATPYVTNLQTDSMNSIAIAQFPCLKTLQCLLEAGAEVNATDKQKNTALHAIAAAELSPGTKQSVIKLLLDGGAYPNARNTNKATPFFLCAEQETKELLCATATITLQTLAACAVVDYCLPYKDILPKRLAAFVSMH